MRRKPFGLALVVFGLIGLGPRVARAAIITVSPSDSYTKIEGAQAGDEVVIAPGTYKYRVYLTQTAPANNPIVIHAADPTNPPVWDLTGTLVEDAPGSYTAGDRGRGCWQISGGTNYLIEGLVLKGCSTASHNSAGLRYYNGASGVILRDIVFQGNDNGLTGGTEDSDIAIEFCEFAQNGTLQAPAGSPSHNIYVYGGTFALRYSYVHDPVQAQNFHIRAKNATLEYNWFARAASYEGDLMTDDDFASGPVVPQSMLLRGNVIVQAANPNNSGQVVAVFNDAAVSGLSLSVTLVNNTFVGNGGHAALVHLSNADGTTMSAELDNNVIYGTSVASLTEDTSKGTVTGTHNWMATGGAATGLSNTLFSASPVFSDAANKNFTLASGSVCLGGAGVVPNLPDKEYYENETVARMYRIRTAVHDIGAFDGTTTGSGIGPYDSSTGTPDGGTTMGDTGAPGDASASSGDGSVGVGGEGGGMGGGRDAGMGGSEGGETSASGDGGASFVGNAGSGGGCGVASGGPAGGGGVGGVGFALLALRRRRGARGRV